MLNEKQQEELQQYCDYLKKPKNSLIAQMRMLDDLGFKDFFAFVNQRDIIKDNADVLQDFDSALDVYWSNVVELLIKCIREQDFHPIYMNIRNLFNKYKMVLQGATTNSRLREDAINSTLNLMASGVRYNMINDKRIEYGFALSKILFGFIVGRMLRARFENIYMANINEKVIALQQISVETFPELPDFPKVINSSNLIDNLLSLSCNEIKIIDAASDVSALILIAISQLTKNFANLNISMHGAIDLNLHVIRFNNMQHTLADILRVLTAIQDFTTKARIPLMQYNNLKRLFKNFWSKNPNAAEQRQFNFICDSLQQYYPELFEERVVEFPRPILELHKMEQRPQQQDKPQHVIKINLGVSAW